MSEIIDELLKSPFTRSYLYNLRRGSSNAKTKRNEEIKELHKTGVSLSEIGRKYGISRQRVFQIINRR